MMRRPPRSTQSRSSAASYVYKRQTDCRVIAPMRELDLAREWEIDYAREHGIDVPVTKEKPWSIDENIWSRSMEGGRLEDPYFEPPEEILSLIHISEPTRLLSISYAVSCL